MSNTQLENFGVAFSMGIGSSRATCACGREFFNSNGDWSFEDNELNKLIADLNATDLDYSVGYIYFAGKVYVVDCDCWQKTAEQVMAFITGYSHQIAEFLKLEKQRKLNEANRMPEVEI